MDKQDKPLSEWTLGEVNQMCKDKSDCKTCIFINKNKTTCKLAGPASLWKLEEKPHLTDPEIAIMRAVGAKWVSLDANLIDESVMLWSVKPDKYGDGSFHSPISVLAAVAEELFPSVKPGECIEYKKEETK